MTRNALKGVLIAVTVLCALASAERAHAARFSGNYLMKLCDIGANGQEAVPGGHAACQAYIAGVLDYHALLQSMKLAPKLDICVGDKVTMNQIHAVVLKYLKENAQHDTFIAAPAVTMALYQAWPCRRK